MARKSRKNIPTVVGSATVQTEVRRPFRAGLYARISMETEETLERGTIETQVELIPPCMDEPDIPDSRL